MLEEGAAHVDDAVDEGDDAGVFFHGGGKVRGRADGGNGDFPGVFPDGANDEVGSLFMIKKKIPL